MRKDDPEVKKVCERVEQKLDKLIKYIKDKLKSAKENEGEKPTNDPDD